MPDVVVTVPKQVWLDWLDEGDLPGDPPMGEEWGFSTWGPEPDIKAGERVYIVAYGRLRGYAPLVAVEEQCSLRPSVGCLLRQGGAVAATIDRPIRGFQGFRYRDWDRSKEQPFPDWRSAGVPADVAAQIAAYLPSASARTMTTGGSALGPSAPRRHRYAAVSQISRASASVYRPACEVRSV